MSVHSRREREGGPLQESSVSRVSRCCYCCCCDDDSLDDGETRMPSPHCLCSRTCHIICISLYISCIASATATASVSPPASACPSHNVLRHSQTGKVKRNNPLFPPTQHDDIQSQKKSQQNTQATTKTGNNSQRVPPRERERIVSHLSILVENIQPAFARPRVRLEKELHRGMRARAYHGVYLWAIRISSEQPCLIVHQGGLARTVRRQSCERNRCVVGVFVPPASPPPSFIPTTTSPRALELESSQVAPSSHDSHHRAQI